MAGEDITKIKEIEKIKIYTFYDFLAFKRTANQRE
jgi:hypothetical protein